MTETINTKYYDTEFTMSSTGSHFTHLRMDPVEKEAWIQALRSGEYQQTKSVLTRADGSGSCCLGVYCEVKQVPKYGEPKAISILSDLGPHDVWQYGDNDADASVTFIPNHYRIQLYDTRTGEPAGDFYGGENIFEMREQGFFDSWEARGYQGTEYALPTRLPILNDEGFTFAQIADIINYFL